MYFRVGHTLSVVTGGWPRATGGDSPHPWEVFCSFPFLPFFPLFSMSLVRPCTLTVHPPEGLGPIDRPTLFKACVGVVPKRDIRCIQYVGSYYRVTFASIEAKEAFASAGLSVNGVNIPLHAPDNTTLVRVVRLPYEVSDANLSLSLGAFGSVTSIAFEKDKVDGLCTGNRLVRMRLDGVIPNRLYVAGYPCYIWYPGQPKRCHVCQSADHLVASCPNRGLCRICRKPGHVAAGCPDKPVGDSRPFSWGKPKAPSVSESDSGSDESSSVADGDDSERLVMDVPPEEEAVSSQEEGDVVPMVEVLEEGDANAPSGSPSLFSSESPVDSVSDPDPATPSTPSEDISMDFSALPQKPLPSRESRKRSHSLKSSDSGRERSSSSRSRHGGRSSSPSK